ncbi:hypothetical protein BDQ12DRAFT_724266 [Crucibulum laeve]|uniref:Uncharacterized protein n=1 Tax=Crucibulum laeve TaxID=68775 RepID=A0A5C3LWC0_9AGAR|nr:hypothetical protein BDQ12DRAFT_724266 [Crucibulum laeve]
MEWGTQQATTSFHWFLNLLRTQFHANEPSAPLTTTTVLIFTSKNPAVPSTFDCHTKRPYCPLRPLRLEFCEPSTSPTMTTPLKPHANGPYMLRMTTATSSFTLMDPTATSVHVNRPTALSAFDFHGDGPSTWPTTDTASNFTPGRPLPSCWRLPA